MVTYHVLSWLRKFLHTIRQPETLFLVALVTLIGYAQTRRYFFPPELVGLLLVLVLSWERTMRMEARNQYEQTIASLKHQSEQTSMSLKRNLSDLRGVFNREVQTNDRLMHALEKQKAKHNQLCNHESDVLDFLIEALRSLRQYPDTYRACLKRSTKRLMHEEGEQLLSLALQGNPEEPEKRRVRLIRELSAILRGS